MNKKSLFNKVFIKSSFDRETTSKVFDYYFEELRKIVVSDRMLLLDEIGVFEVEHRPMTTVKDLKKGAEILLPPKDKIKFRPSESLINALKD
ncbi:MAG: HU family DNA-binding protein [Ignavibacteria bacterium]|nr:HU family DNA-binding protein [Ignavibacteria bacterium]